MYNEHNVNYADLFQIEESGKRSLFVSMSSRTMNTVAFGMVAYFWLLFFFCKMALPLHAGWCGLVG